MSNRLFCACILLCLFCVPLFGCAKKTPKPTPSPQPTVSIEDERTFPQDITYYAKRAGTNKRLLSADQQAQANQRFTSVFFGPWHMEQGTTKASDAVIRKARGYKLGGERWSQEEWDDIVENANMGRYPSDAQPAIIVKNTDLRQMPTHNPRYDKPIVDAYQYPFDDFQYSLLAVGMPVFRTHISRDTRFVFVETPLAAGWVDAEDVADVDQSFINAWEALPQGAILRDGIAVKGLGTPLNIGTMLPIKEQSGKQKTVLLPVKTKTGTSVRTIHLPSSDIALRPLPLTPKAMAQLIARLHGQHYGWGGMYGLRDCSATTHDLLAPFGIWLPRNSRAQQRQGVVIDLSSMDREAKEQTIAQYGTPFLSLVGLPGHITLYVGTHNGRVAILHNIWGVRTYEGENDNGRHIIGKTVITSLTPGWELPNLYRKRIFIDRVRALATPGAH
ncbi:MAG: SH3 domain-containing protein [Desulfovibrio sp.]|nr:SH3 domain-containing protein [Desulfovibrio sp.]